MATVANKKPLNIPICDVQVDTEYDQYVTANFAPCPSYIKYVRVLADESDLATDYLYEDSDDAFLTQYNKANPQEPLSIEKFEHIINTWERATGPSPTLLTQPVAIKLLIDKLNYDINQAQRLSQKLYSYWLQKREKIGKSLVRRYWPLASASDSNPYATFRVRDRERYRLRRQQKKNDLDAFKKMQVLRKEFTKCTTLLCLMYEREKLGENMFRAKRQFFEVKTRFLREEEKRVDSGVGVGVGMGEGMLIVEGSEGEVGTDGR
ncbi:hypothetical protein EON65_58120, partial [archaeon]